MADNGHLQATSKEDCNDRAREDINKRAPEDQTQLQRTSASRRLDFCDENLVKEENNINNFLHLPPEEVHQQTQKAREKWNFDFENEIPLDGDWQWEKIPARPVENKKVVSTMEKKSSENRTV